MKRIIASLLTGGALAQFQPLVYDRTYNDELTDEHLWNGYEQEHAKYVKGNPDLVKHIDGDFFDNHLISRWTGEWLAGDTTWVIAVAKNVPWHENYQYSLPARSVTILNDHFYKGDDSMRFGIVDLHDQEVIKETLGVMTPCIIVLKDGIAYFDNPMQEAYHMVHEFIESKLPDEKIAFQQPVGGRITIPGLYMTYWKREVRNAQLHVPSYAANYLRELEAPQFTFDVLSWYASQETDHQIVINIAIILYILLLQLYFCRYIVCESCFREYKEMCDSIEESERNLPADREKYNKYMEAKEKEQAEKIAKWEASKKRK